MDCWGFIPLLLLQKIPQRIVKNRRPITFYMSGIKEKNEGVGSVSQFHCAKIGLNHYTVAMFILKLFFFCSKLGLPHPVGNIFLSTFQASLKQFQSKHHQILIPSRM